jgi:hypothetical protein
MSIERKTLNCYMGPYSIVRRTQGGLYVLQELNGNVLRHTVAAFRLIPYIQQETLDELVQDSDPIDEGSDLSDNPDIDNNFTQFTDPLITRSNSDTDNSVD